MRRLVRTIPLPGGLPAARRPRQHFTEFIVSRPTRRPRRGVHLRGAVAPGAPTCGSIGAGIRRSLRRKLYQVMAASSELCTRDASGGPATALRGGRRGGVVEGRAGTRLKRSSAGVCVRRVERIDSWAGLRRARVVMAPGDAAGALAAAVTSGSATPSTTLQRDREVQTVFDEAGLDAAARSDSGTERQKREVTACSYRETDLATACSGCWREAWRCHCHDTTATSGGCCSPTEPTYRAVPDDRPARGLSAAVPERAPVGSYGSSTRAQASRGRT